MDVRGWEPVRQGNKRRQDNECVARYVETYV